MGTERRGDGRRKKGVSGVGGRRGAASSVDRDKQGIGDEQRTKLCLPPHVNTPTPGCLALATRPCYPCPCRPHPPLPPLTLPYHPVTTPLPLPTLYPRPVVPPPWISPSLHYLSCSTVLIPIGTLWHSVGLPHPHPKAPEPLLIPLHLHLHYFFVRYATTLPPGLPLAPFSTPLC